MNARPAVEPAGGRGPLREAATWRLLALLFERPRADRKEEIRTLLDELADPDIAGAIATDDWTEGPYLAVLGPGGMVSPREVAWRGTEDPGAILADLRAFYEAFGYAPRAEDPPDHIAVELGFLGYLRLKEAFALQQEELFRSGTVGGEFRGAPPGDDRSQGSLPATVAREAFDHFLEGHLRPWVGSFAARLAEAGAVQPALAAAAVLKRIGGAPALPDESSGPGRSGDSWVSCGDCPDLASTDCLDAPIPPNDS